LTFIYIEDIIYISRFFDLRVRMDENHSGNAKVFKAFCDETRLMVLSLLRSGEKCACVLLDRVRVSQPTLSHHMRVLVESGVVTARKEGKWTYYSIGAEGSGRAVELLREITAVSIETDDSGEERCCT